MAEREGFGDFGVLRPPPSPARPLSAIGLFLAIRLARPRFKSPHRPYKTAEISKLIWRVEGDARRTLQPIEIELLIKIHRKRSMGWLIALDEPIFNKPAKTKEPTKSEPYYDYVI